MTTYPPALRSYINSDQPADIAHAQAECQRLGIDYSAARHRIVQEMVAEQARNEPARERGRAHKGAGHHGK